MLAAQMTIMYSNPVLCALVAWLLRGERLGWQGCVGIAGTLVGVVLVSEPPFLFGGHAWSHTRLVGAPFHCYAPRPLWSPEPARTTGSSACMGYCPAVHNSQ